MPGEGLARCRCEMKHEEEGLRRGFFYEEQFTRSPSCTSPPQPGSSLGRAGERAKAFDALACCRQRRLIQPLNFAKSQLFNVGTLAPRLRETGLRQLRNRVAPLICQAFQQVTIYLTFDGPAIHR